MARRVREPFSGEITPLLVGAWCQLLGDLTARELENACIQVARTCRFFPTVGDIRAQLDRANARGFELKAEFAWQTLLDWVQQNLFPDTGIRRGAPRLEPTIEHAAKAAGGIHFIQRCSEEQLVWCRKTFLAAHKNVHEAEQAQHLLSDSEAKKILSSLNLKSREFPGNSH